MLTSRDIDADQLEFMCRSQLDWKRDGTAWVLWRGRRRMGRVVPDSQWPSMFRWVRSDGRLSDMANLSWVKDAVLGAAVRELEWEVRNKPARDPRKCPENEGSKSPRAPGSREMVRPVPETIRGTFNAFERPDGVPIARAA